MTIRYYTSTAQPTTLALNATPSSTTIEVVALVGYPSSFPYTICLDFDTGLRELVQVDNAAGTTLTVTRAVDGTSAVAHSAGSTVRHVTSARDYADSRTHENSDMGVHGTTGNVVGDTDTQTLTNKTLTAPVINNPTISGGTATGLVFVTPTFTNPTITGTVAGSATYTTPTINGGTQNSPLIKSPVITKADIVPELPGDVPLIVQADPAQSADTFQVFDKTNTKKMWMDNGGTVFFTATTAASGLVSRVDPATSSGNAVFQGRDNANVTKFRVNGTGQTVITDQDNEFMLFLSRAVSVASDAFVYQRGGTPLAGITDDGRLYGSNLTPTWTTWTPTFSAFSGGFVLGNGTVGGRYSIIGKACIVEGYLIRGSTTNFGTGDIQCTMPFNANFSASNQFQLSCAIYDAAANLPYSATALVFDGGAGATNTNFVAYKAGVAGRVSGSGTFPFTWTGNTNASIRFTGTYEMA